MAAVQAPVRARAGAAALTELGQVDRTVYAAVAKTPTPVLDPPLRSRRPGLPSPEPHPAGAGLITDPRVDRFPAKAA